MHRPAFRPAPAPGTSKYGPTGLFTPASFLHHELDPTTALAISSLANHSLTKGTWSAYRTAYKMLRLCFKDTTTSFPLSNSHIITFICWLNNRGLCLSTINSYLAGLRQVHLAKGFTIPVIRSDIVSQILTGKRNLEAHSISVKPTRIAVTPTILRILKITISADNLPLADKKLFWLVCTLAFHGSFRIGELLTRSPLSFDPAFTLLSKDIFLNVTHVNNVPIKFIEINLNSSKTSMTKAVVLDVYPTNNDLCPVRAYIKWSSSHSSTNNLPAFRLNSGKSLTPNLFNSKLRFWLRDHIDYSKVSVSGHSFRAGIPTILATMGFADKDLQAAGRWSSRAFEAYIKLPRTKRISMAKALGNLRL